LIFLAKIYVIYEITKDFLIDITKILQSLKMQWDKHVFLPDLIFVFRCIISKQFALSIAGIAILSIR